MTEEQQRIAIAEACGWTCCGQVQGLNPHGLVPWRKIVDYTTQQILNHEIPMDTLPDYLNDLNAMHEAENVLTGYPQRVTYYETLSKIVGYLAFEFVRATASQRAEAFLRTIGKWTNNQPTEETK